MEVRINFPVSPVQEFTVWPIDYLNTFHNMMANFRYAFFSLARVCPIIVQGCLLSILQAVILFTFVSSRHSSRPAAGILGLPWLRDWPKTRLKQLRRLSLNLYQFPSCRPNHSSVASNLTICIRLHYASISPNTSTVSREMDAISLTGSTNLEERMR